MAKILRAVLESLEHRRLLSTSTSGAIDPSFGQSGIGSAPVAGASFTNALDMTIQPDGKIIVVGSAEFDTDTSDSGTGDTGDGDQDIALARFNADGTPDTTFGNAGVVLTDLSAPDAEASRVVLDGNKILIAGDANGNWVLARYNSTGSLDTSFGSGGTVSLDLGSDDDKAFGVAVESNGTIVADGQSGGQLVLAGFNNDGSLDTSFGTSGKTITDAPGFTESTDPTTDGTGNTLDGSGGVRILNNGKLVVVSNEADTDGTGRVDLAYFNSNGTLSAFDRGDSQSDAPDVVGFAFPGHGKIITFSSDGTDTLQRYNADATLDKTFGVDGTANSSLNWGADGSIAPNGQIIVAGSASIGYDEGAAVERFNANGSVDHSFGTSGVVISPSAGYDGASAMVDFNGNIVAVASSYGATSPALTAVRYLPSVGVTPPQAILVSSPILTHTGENQELLTVSYLSTDGLDTNSLEDGNLTVTRDDGSDNTLSTYYLSSSVTAPGVTTVVYQVQKDYAGHYFDALDNGNYTVSIDQGSVYDLDGAPVASGTLGTFSINIAAPPGGISGPTASLNPTAINTVDVTDQNIAITFASSIGIDTTSIGGDVIVTGPGGFDQYASYVSQTTNSDGTVTATFDLQHDDSHAVFTAADNGTYTVSMEADVVEDIDGNSSAAATVGTFHVGVPKTSKNAAGPTATLQAPELTDPTAKSETLTVTYTGPSAISTNTLDDDDLLITGPSSFSDNATFVSSTANSDGSTTATYSVSEFFFTPLTGTTTVSNSSTPTTSTPVASGPIKSAPIKSAPAKSAAIAKSIIIDPPYYGQYLQNGTYSVALVAGQVNDLRGIAAGAATLGTFIVNQPAHPAPIIGPIVFDSSNIALVSTGKSTSVDAHHQALASLSSDTTKSSPTRAHANLPKHKHKHKKKAATPTKKTTK